MSEPDMFCCLLREATVPPAPDAIEAVARVCSPRVAVIGADAVLFDASGLSRGIGPPDAVGREVLRMAGERGVSARVALAETMTAAWLLAASTPGMTVALPGRQAGALAALPLRWLGTVPDFESLGIADRARRSAARDRSTPAAARPARRRRASARHYRMAPGPAGAPPAGTAPAARLPDVDAHLATFERWGLGTLADVARLPRADLHARMGPAGVRLHQAACGEDAAPFVPVGEARRFVERCELDWPIEGLEPLSFVLSRVCETLSTSLERADRGAIGVTTRLQLVTKAGHTRTLRLPAAMRDGRVLRTLILLDLESHPPPAGIDVVEVEVDVAPGLIVQGSLLARALPTTEQVTTLVARLGALMGESRVGAPVEVDSHDDRGVAIRAFAVTDAAGPGHAGSHAGLRLGFRRFRPPIVARVLVERGLPVRVLPSARGLPGGAVIASAGPWRSSGRWWTLTGAGWDRDEWDVELEGGPVYRLSRDRASGRWEIEGIAD
jgi:hypothetical protein